MIVYLVLIVFLLAAAVWFLSRPLSPVSNQHAEEEGKQLLLVRDRLLGQLGELDSETEDKGVDSAVAEDEKRRLEAELAQVLRVLEGLEARTESPVAQGGIRTRRRVVIAVLAVVLPLLTLGLFSANNYSGLARLAAYRSAPQDKFPPVVMEMVARLEKRLVEQPDDALGWARLGRAYQVLGRMEDSKAAYTRAYRLAPDNAEILASYAVMRYSEEQSNPSEEVERLFQRLLAINPRNTSALWVTGLAAYNRGDFNGAVNNWSKVIQLLPEDSPILPQIRKALAQAQADAQQKQ